jgi:acetoin utilization deacetylase AcuC-like enzyme
LSFKQIHNPERVELTAGGQFDSLGSTLVAFAVMADHAVYFSDKFVLSRDAFDTTRKAAWIAASLDKDPIPGVRLCSPKSATLADARRVHSENYLRALQTGQPAELASSSKINWDDGVLPMTLSACGGILAAGKAAQRDGVAGCLASGFHHAKRDRGDGFCTLNGLAITAHALAEGNRDHILIVDLDAHCGGGTNSLIQNHPRLWQVDVSVMPYDDYVPGERCIKEIVTDARHYLKTVWRCVQQAEAEWPLFALCLYNAGMDIHQDCKIGGLAGVDEFIITLREEMVFQWCGERGIPIAFALAGGYTGGKMTRKRLVDLHRLTLSCAAKTVIRKASFAVVNNL